MLLSLGDDLDLGQKMVDGINPLAQLLLGAVQPSRILLEALPAQKNRKHRKNRTESNLSSGETSAHVFAVLQLEEDGGDVFEPMCSCAFGHCREGTRLCCGLIVTMLSWQTIQENPSEKHSVAATEKYNHLVMKQSLGHKKKKKKIAGLYFIS